MRGQKKHPLEVFRSAGRPLGTEAPTPRETDVEQAPEPRRQAEAPSEEFQLLLTLNGGLILLFVWVVLMGAAYLYGYQRGAASERADRDQAALAKGREIAEGTTSPNAGAGAPAATERPFGVLIVTYERSDWKDRFSELRRTLRDKYGVSDLYPWDRGEKIEVMAGVFSSKDDPRLSELAGRIRRIADWPHGSNKEPFKSAYLKNHPDDPGRARRASNAGDSE